MDLNRIVELKILECLGKYTVAPQNVMTVVDLVIDDVMDEIRPHISEAVTQHYQEFYNDRIYLDRI